MPGVERVVVGRRHRLRQSVILLLVGAVLLWIVVAIVPGVSTSGEGSALAAIIVLAAVSAALRPLLAALASPLGWLGVIVVGLFAQAFIFFAALSVAPGISLSGFWPAFWTAWLFALLVGCVGWLLDANDDEVFLREVLRHANRHAAAVPSERPGVVIVQIDGLPAPLLRWAVQAGDLPTLSRWMRAGSHRLVEWHAQLPATTPASQAGILHGRSDAVPAFRWYERKSARLTVSSRPRDAAYVEKGLTTGRGLLVDGGVSIGNIFSGDAPRSFLTMSAGRGHGPSRQFTASYMQAFGLARALVLTVGEMVKEIYQGFRQQARDIQPRINRRSTYIALRGLTNVLLRDLNVRLLAEQMMMGAPVMYCDFTDYDEVAHHAGPTRPESLASLLGVDRALAVLERVALAAPRPYEFVVLSDHGQSQGATFRQRYGESLEDTVRRHMTPHADVAPQDGGTVVSSTGRDEEWGAATTFMRDVGSGRGPVARLCRRIVSRRETGAADANAPHLADVIVTGSGNLAFVYFPRHPERLSWEQLDRLHPGLVRALAEHDGIGFVVVVSESRGAVTLGRDGAHFLDEHRVEGVDPLGPFGPNAADDVRRHARLAHVGDIVVNSRIDVGTGEVAAFEELVGCHGGLGGWQSDAVLVHPSTWATPPLLVGADAVHRQLVRWLEDLGQRAGLPTETAALASTSRGPSSVG